MVAAGALASHTQRPGFSPQHCKRERGLGKMCYKPWSEVSGGWDYGLVVEPFSSKHGALKFNCWTVEKKAIQGILRRVTDCVAVQ